MNEWYVIYCKSQQDAKAELNLARQGFDIYRPTRRTKSKNRSGKITLTTESLFPRYIFLNIDANVRSIAPVSSTYGVSKFIKFGSEYAKVSDQLIDQLRTSENTHTCANSSYDFLKGDKIIVEGSGFDCIEGVFQNPCGESRALVLLSILGQQSKIDVPNSYIRKVINA